MSIIVQCSEPLDRTDLRRRAWGLLVFGAATLTGSRFTAVTAALPAP